jgi:hypothetical protein
MSTSNIEHLVELAATSLLNADTTLTALHVNPSVNTETLSPPYLLVKADCDGEKIKDTGVQTVKLTIGLFVQADDSGSTTCETYWDALQAVIYDDALSANLSGAATNFKCFGAIRGRQYRNVIERRWDCGIETTLFCRSLD